MNTTLTYINEFDNTTLTRTILDPEAAVAEAEKEYLHNDNIEIETTDPVISQGEDNHGPIGAWVRAWVWVEYPEEETEREGT